MFGALRETIAKIRPLFRSGELDRDVELELAAHVELLAEEHVRRGATPEEAIRLARIEVGGRNVTINDTPVTIVGVTPASFDFASVFVPGTHIDLFLPMPLTEETNRNGNSLALVGRLKSGVSIESARAEFTALADELVRQHPERNPLHPGLGSLDEHVSGRLRPALSVLAAAVGIVMLIVWANVGSLQMARAVKRRKETAVRAAIGAGRGRLIRRALTESMVLRPVAPELSMEELRTVQELVDRAVSPRRFVVGLISGFTIFALMLAALGIYAVISYSVNQRQHEIGIRMALGARPRDVLWPVVAQGMLLALVGLAIGLAGASAVGRVLESLLFGVSASDLPTYAGGIALLVAVALAACLLPARRAARVDPLVALRHD